MKKNSFIITIIIILAAILIAFCIYHFNLFSSKVICSSSGVTEPGEPIKIKIYANTKDGIISSVDVKKTYESEADAKAYCDIYKEEGLKVDCSGKTVTLYSTDEFDLVNGESISTMKKSSYKKLMKSSGYKCR